MSTYRSAFVNGTRPGMLRTTAGRAGPVMMQGLSTADTDGEAEGVLSELEMGDGDELTGGSMVTVSAGAQAVLEDLAERPEYYLNVAGVLFGLTLVVLVLSATMAALDSIPLLPDALRVVGLGYIFWFLSKYLFSGAERSRLQGEIADFVSGVRNAEPAMDEPLQ